MSELSPLGSPEIPIKQQCVAIRSLSTSLPIAVNQCSVYTNGISLQDLSTQLHLADVLRKPEEYLAKHGITIEPHTIARRKADVVTTASAIHLLEQNDPDVIVPAGILLASNYSTQAELNDIKTTAITQGGGLETDRSIISQVLGYRAISKLDDGTLDRLTAVTVAQYAQTHTLDPNLAMDILRSIQMGTTPQTIDAACHIQSVKHIIELSKALKPQIIQRGLRPENIPFSRLSTIAIRTYDQIVDLQKNPKSRTELLTRLAEQGKIPQSIQRLQDIIQIVDQNPEIRAVSFDLYDTLVQWSAEYSDRYAQFPKYAITKLARIGIIIPEELFTRVCNEVRGEVWNQFQSKGIEVPFVDSAEIIVQRIIDSGIPLNDKQTKQMIHLLQQEWYRHVELDTAITMPGAKETLEALKHRGIKICLTSNAQWSRSYVYRVLYRFGLLEYFDQISISSEPKKMKKRNQDEFFHHSWDKLNLPYNTILHVGDNAHDDVDGARSAGGLSTLYANPISSAQRLERNGLRFQNPELYASTSVALHEQSLESDAFIWIAQQIEQSNIPSEEKKRTIKLCQELYRRSRDIIAPIYINMADRMLKELNDGHYDCIVALARDGLPVSLAAKLLLVEDPYRYPKVKSEQIMYLYASRKILDRVIHPQSEADKKLREKYLQYLRQKQQWKGKRVYLADVVTSGKTTTLATEILQIAGASSVRALLVDTVVSENRDSFLKSALHNPGYDLGTDIALLELESLFNGSFESVTDIEETQSGAVRPVSIRKNINANVETRGLSRESLIMFNRVAIKGLMDATRIRHRARIAGFKDPTDNEVATKFVSFFDRLHFTPLSQLDDLTASIPWPDHGQWYLPRNNHVIKGYRERYNQYHPNQPRPI